MTRAERTKAFALAAKALMSVTCTKQAIGDADPLESLAKSLKSRRSALVGYVDGSKPIPRDGRVVRQLIYRCVGVADMISDRDRLKADVLNTRARALDGEIYRQELRERQEWSAQMDARAATHKLLKPGLHIAPFLSERGEMVMLAVDQWHRLGTMLEIDTMSSGRCPSGASDTRTAASADEFYAAYSHALLPEGVHVMQWRPWETWENGVVYVAIDAQHRLVATIECPDIKDTAALVAAQRDMRAALEIVKDARATAPTSYRDSDGYEDSDDDDFRGGDEWKIRTPYDPRTRR